MTFWRGLEQKKKHSSETNQRLIDAANAVADILAHKRKTEELKGDEKNEPNWCKRIQMKLEMTKNEQG